MKRSGLKKAAAAVARKLAIIMLKMWQTGQAFIWGEKKEKAKEEIKGKAQKTDSYKKEQLIKVSAAV